MAKNSNTNSKTSTTKTTVTPPVAKNDNSKKKSTSTTNTKSIDTFFNDLSKQLGTKVTATQATTNTKTNSGTGSGQTGKKRGSYSQNLWAIEFREDNKYLADPREIYLSRNDARDALEFFRSETSYKKGDVRLAKYTFNRADHS